MAGGSLKARGPWRGNGGQSAQGPGGHCKAFSLLSQTELVRLSEQEGDSIIGTLASTLRPMGNFCRVLNTGGNSSDFMFTKDALTSVGRADSGRPRAELAQ